jgi:ubiquinone/menaquinone biosynthesis C-methylase UbiE
MSKANDTNIVKTQYSSDKNLNARRELHTRFSTNKYGWSKWLFDKYVFTPNCKVIEFGCGNGALWKENIERIPSDVEIVLSDFSEGMVDASKANLNSVAHIKSYRMLDIQSIPYEDSSFDVVIANHMLYHVPNRDRAIKEVYRILKPGGVFYASTNGLNHMKGLKSLIQGFDSRIQYKDFSIAGEFGLENGEEQLRKSFNSVERHIYEDSLKVTEAQPLVDYALSLGGHINIDKIVKETYLNEFYNYINGIIAEESSITILKSSGIFIAKK